MLTFKLFCENAITTLLYANTDNWTDGVIEECQRETSYFSKTVVLCVFNVSEVDCAFIVFLQYSMKKKAFKNWYILFLNVI